MWWLADERLPKTGVHDSYIESIAAMLHEFVVNRSAVLAVLLSFSLALIGIVPRVADAQELDSTATQDGALEELVEQGMAAWERGDTLAAFESFMEGARKGHPPAQLHVGAFYYNGLAVARDLEVSRSWWQKAADQGNFLAALWVGLSYKNERRLGTWEPEKALNWIQIAADSGSARAQVELGNMYLHGIGAERDASLAVKWFRAAAVQGNLRAQKELGALYFVGLHVAQDDSEAARWYKKAAESGDPDAQYMVGLLYHAGSGVYQDYERAVHWTSLAAQRGHAQAQALLGEMYLRGEGVPQDYVAAHMWLNLGASNALIPDVRDRASRMRDGLAQRMTSSQISEAQRAARDWARQNGEDQTPRHLPNERLASGTAFFVTGEGHALTNAHVINQCQSLRMEYGNTQLSAEVIAIDERNDLAVIRAERPTRPTAIARLRLSASQGEDIAVYGYPLPGLLASGGNFTTGNVTALAGLSDDTRLMQISAPVQSGSSGGPVVDRSGNVIGVVVSKLDAVALEGLTGEVPQSVNFAIKATVAAEFLTAHRIDHQTQPRRTPLNGEALTNHVRDLTLRVLCQK